MATSTINLQPPTPNPQPPTHIYLVGMSGVGKTTIGKKIANILKYRFIDLDFEIEKMENKTISEIFEKNGEEYFREKESEMLRNISEQNVVVATGGGTPCHHNNMEFIKKNGLCIYIKASKHFIFSRIKQFPDKRPMLKGMNSGQILEFVKKMLAEREPLYMQADLVSELPGATAETIIKSMVSV